MVSSPAGASHSPSSSRGSPGRGRHARSRARARPGGAVDRTWHRPRGPCGSPVQEGCAPTGAGVDGGRRELRSHLDGIRLARHRRGDRARGRRPGWTDTTARTAPRPDRCRARLPRLHRHGRLDRTEHQRVGAEPIGSATVRRAWVGRFRVDDSARDRGRHRRLRHRRTGQADGSRRLDTSIRAHRRRFARGRRACDRLQPGDRRTRKCRAVLGEQAFERSSRTLRACRSLRSHCCWCSRASPGASPWGTFEAAQRSRPCSSVLPQDSSPPTCRGFPRHPPSRS